MTDLTDSQINEEVLQALRPPRPLYWLAVLALAVGIGCMFSAWAYQCAMGMGVAGINHPVGWGVYIVNFVFWVGIAHSGTLISAILHLVRSRWRNAVSRAAEAMTIFAVMTAGLFPLIHLGRLWVFYYILPYPSQRQLWPNFTSPLVWDVVAISTYLTVSIIFFYVGCLPDLAALRDEYTRRLGKDNLRSRIYGRLALNWSGSGSQWRHYGRGYLYFAALATPLVVSVHSVVSWDFAMGILPGWHTTIFAPYFVAGAIHSGLAMVLTLLIPLRKLLKLERIITVDSFDSVAKTILVTASVVGYAYVVEPFIAWYSGDLVEQQFAWWRATGWLAWAYWALLPLNVLFPLLFVFRRVRRSLPALFVIALLINVGMWLERFFIIVGSTSHDFLPHNWGQYRPTWVELTIAFGSLAFFLFWFFLFSKFVPQVAANEIKERLAGRDVEPPEGDDLQPLVAPIRGQARGVLGIYASADALAATMRQLRDRYHLETFSPCRLAVLEEGGRPSPVRLWTLLGALTGLAGGFGLAIGSAMVNSLVVGGKMPVSIIPYCVIGFEGTILLGSIGNLIGLLVHCRLGKHKPLPAMYDGRFSRDRFGLFVQCTGEQSEGIQAELVARGAEEVHVRA